MFRHYRVIVREIVISISSGAVGSTISN